MSPMTLEWVPPGPERGRAVLLHGMLSLARTWWRIGPEMAERGWHTYAFDLPGHGDAGRMRRPFDLKTLTDAVSTQFDATPGLQLPVDLLIGHSLGAVVALSLADQRPEIARALVLEDPPGTSARDRDASARQLLADAELARRDRARLVRRERTANPGWDIRDVEHSVEGIALADTSAIAAGLRRPREWHLVDLIATTAVPVLVLAAPDNPMLPAEDAPSALRGLDREAVQRLLPPGNFAILSGGHCLHRDQPERWLARVSAFADVALRRADSYR
jgi:pimeloyl-ACP methyl ester carboxylesterase